MSGARCQVPGEKLKALNVESGKKGEENKRKDDGLRRSPFSGIIAHMFYNHKGGFSREFGRRTVLNAQGPW